MDSAGQTRFDTYIFADSGAVVWFAPFQSADQVQSSAPQRHEGDYRQYGNRKIADGLPLKNVRDSEG
jgi:hypothetical protein